MFNNIFELGIVGKGGHTPPLFWANPSFSKISTFLEIQDVPTFYRPIGKTKVLNESSDFYMNSTHKVS